MLSVYTFDQEEWVVAESPEDAAKVYIEETKAAPLPIDDYPAEWRTLPNDKTITMRDVDGEGTGDVTKTCAEWAAGGRRYLGSANY